MRTSRSALAVAALAIVSWGPSAPSGASTPAKSPCAVPIEDRAAADVPAEVADFAGDRPVVGDGSLWLLVNGARPRYSFDDDRWELRKVVWYRLEPGTIQIDQRRVRDGRVVTVAIPPDGYGATGFRPSGLVFPRDGCWLVTATLGASVVTFGVRIPKGEAGICRDLEAQLENARQVENGFARRVQGAIDERECDVSAA